MTKFGIKIYQIEERQAVETRAHHTEHLLNAVCVVVGMNALCETTTCVNIGYFSQTDHVKFSLE